MWLFFVFMDISFVFDVIFKVVNCGTGVYCVRFVFFIDSRFGGVCPSFAVCCLIYYC